MTDALLSPIGFSVLSGAGLFKDEKATVHVHSSALVPVSFSESNKLTLNMTDALGPGEEIDDTAPVFVSIAESDNSITGVMASELEVKKAESTTIEGVISTDTPEWQAAKVAFVDFYITKKSANVSEIQIDASNFGGYYYVEASTLFRRQSDGVDMPAEITIPNVKIQSNFTFNMAATGDPSELMRLAA